MPVLRVPPPAPPGSRIHVVAPAWAIDAERVEAGIRRLDEAGYEVVAPDAVHARQGFLAGNDATRAGAFGAALEDETARVVWVAQGGYGSTRLLPALDPARVAAHPKLLVGFSDATALHALWHRAGVATIHGPTLSTLAGWSEAAWGELLRLLAGEAGDVHEGEYASADAIRGPLLGGNLSLLASLVGTGSLPGLEGAILLLEDVDERTYRLDRYAEQLKQSGLLDRVAGLVLGQFTACGSTRGDRTPPETILRDAFAACDVPILSGIAVGHDDTSRALWLGRRVRIDPAGPGRGVLSIEA